MLSEIFVRVFLLALFVGTGISQTREGERCVVEYTQTWGVCTISYRCQSARRDYQNGIQPTICARGSFGTLVCCRDRSNILQVAPQRTSTTTERRPVWGSSSGGTKRLSERKCEEYSRPVQQVVGFVSLLPEPDSYSVTASKCNYTSLELIVGGTNAELGEFPHMAAIGWVNFEGGYSWDCGGSLISPNFVLTAGHCTRNPNARDPDPSVVRLGDRNINPAVYDGARPVEVPIKRIIKHPEYCPSVRYNDLALMQLLTAVEFETNIRPACLWTGGEFEQDKAVATGWGISDVRHRLQSEELQKVSLPLLDNRYCNQLLMKNRDRNWWGFRDTQLCAGELRGGKDTCQGDSGAPLQMASKDNQCIYHIIGLTSFGHKCGERGKPAVYTRVSAYIDWIESVVWADEFGVTPQTESLCPPQ